MSNDSSQISDREREILRLVATGATNQQIAYQLNISINTVKVHLRNIFGKIGVTSRTEATLYAVRNGLVLLNEASIAAPTAVAEAPPEERGPLEPPAVETGAASEIANGSSAESDWETPPIAPIAIPSPAPTAARWPWLLGGGLLAVALVISAVIFISNQAAP